MLPPMYGQNTPVIVKQGNVNHYGNLNQQLAKISGILSGYEKNVEEAEKTQAKIQILTNMGIIVMGIGGSYLIYKFLTDLRKQRQGT